MTLRGRREGQKRLEGYRTRSLHYLDNAAGMLSAEEWEKGSEMLWGAFAQAVKALAISRDRLLRRHDEIHAYAAQAARELGDRDISNALVRAERLHSDFYEGFLRPEDIAEDMEYIRKAVGRFLDLAASGSRQQH